MAPLSPYHIYTMNSPERRHANDRRVRPTPPLSRYLFFRGHRRGPRRLGDPQSIYVDRLGTGIGLALISIFLFHCLDALFTLLHLGRGGIELNPLMRFVLQYGAGPFVAVKLATAGAGLIFLGVHKNFPYVQRGIAVLFVIYGTLVGYHCYLIMHS